MNAKLGFIGTGNMAGAIIGGVVGKGVIPPAQIGVYDISAEQLAPYKAAGHPVFAGIPQLVAACEIVVLSVKPQKFSEVLPLVAQAMTPEKIIVSIAAGITAKTIKEAMGFDCKVVLAMPNTPLMLGVGATALGRVEPTTEEEFGMVMDIFAAAGVAAGIDPGLMDEVIPVNGSSPAFIYQFAKVIVDNAQAMGLDSQAAMALFCQTLTGSAKMLMESGKTPQELITMVCSPGGATLEGMKALADNGFDKAVSAACTACVKRAKELSQA